MITSPTVFLTIDLGACTETPILYFERTQHLVRRRCGAALRKRRRRAIRATYSIAQKGTSP